MNKIYLSNLNYNLFLKAQCDNLRFNIKSLIFDFKINVEKNKYVEQWANDNNLINDYLYLGVYMRDNTNNNLSDFYNDYLKNKEIFYTNINNSNDLNHNKKSFVDLVNPYIEITDEELFYIKLKYDISLNN